MKLPCAPFSSRVRSLLRLALRFPCFLFFNLFLLSISRRVKPHRSHNRSTSFQEDFGENEEKCQSIPSPFQSIEKKLSYFYEQRKNKNQVSVKRKAEWTLALQVHAVKEAKRQLVSPSRPACVMATHRERNTATPSLHRGRRVTQPASHVTLSPASELVTSLRRHGFTATQDAWPEIATHVVLRVSVNLISYLIWLAIQISTHSYTQICVY